MGPVPCSEDFLYRMRDHYCLVPDFGLSIVDMQRFCPDLLLNTKLLTPEELFERATPQWRMVAPWSNGNHGRSYADQERRLKKDERPATAREAAYAFLLFNRFLRGGSGAMSWRRTATNDVLIGIGDNEVSFRRLDRNKTERYLGLVQVVKLDESTTLR